MRNMDERRAEVYRRAARRKENARRLRSALVSLCLPVMLTAVCLPLLLINSPALPPDGTEQPDMTRGTVGTLSPTGGTEGIGAFPSGSFPGGISAVIVEGAGIVTDAGEIRLLQDLLEQAQVLPNEPGNFTSSSVEAETNDQIRFALQTGSGVSFWYILCNETLREMQSGRYLQLTAEDAAVLRQMLLKGGGNP